MSDGFRYFEDYVPGQSAETAAKEVTETDIIRFAAEFDPQPMHTDPAAAQEITGGLIASGWHTAALTMRLVLDSRSEEPAPGTFGLGFEELRWLRPVRPKDVLRVRIDVLEARLSDSRPDRGIVTSRFTTLNQRDEPVQTLIIKVIAPRRSAQTG